MTDKMSDKMKEVAPSAGAIFGIVFAGIIGVVALGGLFVWIKNKLSDDEDEVED